jgi:hypothetical protein
MAHSKPRAATQAARKAGAKVHQSNAPHSFAGTDVRAISNQKVNLQHQ